MADNSTRLWDLLSQNMQRQSHGLTNLPYPEEPAKDPLDDPDSPQSKSVRSIFASTRYGSKVAANLGPQWDRTPGKAIPSANSMVGLMAEESADQRKPPPTPKAEPMALRALFKQTPTGQRLEQSNPGLLDTMPDEDLRVALARDTATLPKPEAPAKPLTEQDNPASAASEVARQEFGKTSKGAAALAQLDAPKGGKLADPRSAELSANAIEDLKNKVEKGTGPAVPKAKGAAMDLRKEFDGLPEVKEFKTVNTMYEKAKGAAESQTAAGDMSLIYAFMKIVDPNSSVREGEFAAAQNSGSSSQKIEAAFQRVKSGERLTPEQRADFVNQALVLRNANAGAYVSAAERYRGMAKKAEVDPDEVALLPKGYSAPTPDIPEKHAGKVKVTNVATGDDVWLTPESAEKLKKAGKVR